MAKQQKFGAFSGVFTPSVLTILGVIMYMRMGWVVGNAGLVGTIIIVLISHIISVSTGLSVSSISTDKKVGAGGIYYILSRSMGIPIGGAIGITLYVGTAASISLYLIGFAESFNDFIGFDGGLNGLRITGAISLVVLTAIALISTSFALKTQFFILAAIIISLISIFMGTTEFAPTEINPSGGATDIPMATIFAIFFPAVTGFTAGIAMSGDLQDPKKSIPSGTLAAIAVGLIVYIALAFFLTYYVSPDLLKTDNNILMKIAKWSPAVVAGIWGATLSSALGGILGGPRILQAMSIDRVTPKIFGKGKGKSNEPINALALVFIIALGGILIGELDVIARVVSMFYLAAYGFINISFFLEKWANPDFRPSFNVNRWFGLIGFIACFGVMFQLDMMAMFASFLVIGGLYYWLKRKQIELDSNDVWQSVWNKIVAKGLKQLETQDSKQKQWNPNIILFSGGTKQRPHLLEFSKLISGERGLVTNFNLIDRDHNKKALSKNEQIIKDPKLDALGIFGRQVEVDNIYQGIENIATTFGFSGVEPNTVMIGWAKNAKKPTEFAKMTKRLMDLDYNIMYLDYDERYALGNHQTIDLWWRDAHNNAELMLNICRFIIQSPEWANVQVRVLFVNQNNADSSIVKLGITKLLEKLRIKSEIKIINNGVDQKPIYKIIEQHSSKTDLVLLGVPFVEEGKEALFVEKTNHLFEAIGTTLLVRASNDFNALELDFSMGKNENDEKIILDIPPLHLAKNPIIATKINHLDQLLVSSLESLHQNGFLMVTAFYKKSLNQLSVYFKDLALQLEKTSDKGEMINYLGQFYTKSLKTATNFSESNLEIMQEKFEEHFDVFINSREQAFNNIEKKLSFETNGKKETIKWRALIDYYRTYKMIPKLESELGNYTRLNHNLLYIFTETINTEINVLLQNLIYSKDIKKELSLFKTKGGHLFESLIKDSTDMSNLIFEKMSIIDRSICNQITKDINTNNWDVSLKLKSQKDKKQLAYNAELNIRDFSDNYGHFQKMFHNQSITALQLGMATNALTEVHIDILNHIETDFISPQFDRLKRIEDILLNIKKNTKLDSNQFDLLTNISNEHISFVPTNLLDAEEENLMNISSKSKQSIELMSQEAQRNMIENVNRDTDTITLELAKIQDYIIRTNYTSPLQNVLQELQLGHQKNEDGIQHLVFVIKQLFEEEEIANSNNLDKSEEIDDLFEKIKLKKIDVEDERLTFAEALDINLSQTTTELNIKSILESIESLNQYANSTDLTGKFSSWSKDKYNTIHNYWMSINQKLQNQKRASYLDKHTTDLVRYRSPIESTVSFMDTVVLKPEVGDHLSIYYKKLFSGGHLGTNMGDSYLDAQQKVISFKRQISNGEAGALMILGGAQMGKTYFIKSIAQEAFDGSVYTIYPPQNNKYTKGDLKMGFEEALKKKGTIDTLLKRLPQGQVFVFNDLERWWLKAKNGNVVINYLVEIIEKYGDKHHFLLNANIHSYSIMRKLTNIDEILLTNIILPQMNSKEIGEIIINRHNIADGKMSYQNEDIKNIKSNHRLFNQINKGSKGRIGVALTQWLSAIDLDKNDAVYITYKDNIHFNNPENPIWSLLLYHFIIHNGLGKIHLEKLFGQRMKEEINVILQEMIKSGLVVSLYPSYYVISKKAKFFVEQFLTEQKLIN